MKPLVLQRLHRWIVPEHVVADNRSGHGRAHRLGRFRHRIAARVDDAVGKLLPHHAWWERGQAQSGASLRCPRRRYRDEEDEENDAWEWIDDNVLSRVVLDDGDELEAIQALAEAQFLVERARGGFSEKARAGKLAAVIERKVLSLGDDASRSFVKAITACVDACKRAKVIPAKRVQLFEPTVEAKPHRTREGDATPDQRSGVVTIFSRGRSHRNSHAV